MSLTHVRCLFAEDMVFTVWFWLKLKVGIKDRKGRGGKRLGEWVGVVSGREGGVNGWEGVINWVGNGLGVGEKR